MTEKQQWGYMYLKTDEVHIWLLRTNGISIQPEMKSVLDNKECLYLLRYNSRFKREQFIWGRWFCRQVLAQYFHIGPEHVPLTINANGRLETDNGWDVNLSHTYGGIACVVGKGRRVGTDIEYTNRKIITRDWRHVFSSMELTELNQLTDEAQKNYFLKLWTIKEALWKSWNVGKEVLFNEFSVEVETGKFCPQNQIIPADNYLFESQKFGKEFVVSVAAQQYAEESLCFRYFYRTF